MSDCHKPTDKRMNAVTLGHTLLSVPLWKGNNITLLILKNDKDESLWNSYYVMDNRLCVFRARDDRS